MKDRVQPVPPIFTPAAGDPTLELFGQGWTPTPAPVADSYEGRHRVPDE